MGFFNPFIGNESGGSGGTTNYRQLTNKPSINGVILNGNLLTEDLYIIESKTTAEWNETPQLISKKNTIYVYTDFDTTGGVNKPAIKVGDGLSYVNALPFLAGSSVSITPSQVESWDNKVTAYIDETDNETLVLSF